MSPPGKASLALSSFLFHLPLLLLLLLSLLLL
jgi:hypothetical protein